MTSAVPTAGLRRVAVLVLKGAKSSRAIRRW